ncbi:MAG: tetratricopeptide repeat protein [Chitinophagaceae bacterium]
MREKAVILLIIIVASGCAQRLSSTGGTSSSSTNIDRGKKYLYYQRYESAKDIFKKALVSNPGNLTAVYWLGQALIHDKDSMAAKTLYQKTLSTNASAPLVLAGMGQIELMENKPDVARQRFESAIELSKKTDVEVIHAIARANVDAPPGDANYAIEKLNSVPKLKKRDYKTPETYLILGEAYRKLINGGAAVTAFNQALSMDPSLAEAKYKIGKVYLSQNNPQFFLPAFQDAISIDSNYAPALYELFFYWFERDINKAREYFNKYLAVSDNSPSTEYDRTSVIYASRDYQTAIDSAMAKIKLRGEKSDPRYYKLVAYSYDALKDSVNAKNYLDQYFTKQSMNDFVPQDYVFRGKLLSKFPGNEEETLASYQKAVDLDTSLPGKLKIMTDAATFAAGKGIFKHEAEWLGKIYNVTKEPSNRDIYDWGYAHYKAGDFETADSIFCNVYIPKFPTEIFGYLWCARAAGAQDTTMEKGTAVEPYKRLISFARASGEREDYKSTLIQAHGYLASYYANVAKDKDSAVLYLQNILKLDSTNESAIQYIEILTKPEPKAPSTPKATRTRKKSSAKK